MPRCQLFVCSLAYDQICAIALPNREGVASYFSFAFRNKEVPYFFPPWDHPAAWSYLCDIKPLPSIGARQPGDPVRSSVVWLDCRHGNGGSHHCDHLEVLPPAKASGGPLNIIPVSGEI